MGWDGVGWGGIWAPATEAHFCRDFPFFEILSPTLSYHKLVPERKCARMSLAGTGWKKHLRLNFFYRDFHVFQNTFLTLAAAANILIYIILVEQLCFTRWFLIKYLRMVQVNPTMSLEPSQLISINGPWSFHNKLWLKTALVLCTSWNICVDVPKKGATPNSWVTALFTSSGTE